MRLLRPSALALLCVFATSSAWADDDDLLSPLSPVAPKKKAKPRPKPKAVKAIKHRQPVVSDGDDLLAPLTPVAKTELLVKVAGGIRGAKLFIDRKDVGFLPGPAVEVSAGEHQVVVKRPGYADFSKTVSAVTAKQVELVATLEPVAGLLSVTGDVDGATVWVDGKEVGAAPIFELVLPPGEHEVAIRKPGFQEQREKLSVRAGKEYPIPAKLVPDTRVVSAYGDRPERTDLGPADRQSGPLDPSKTVSADEPLYGRWYVWVGAAAVVAAAATGTVVATQNAQPRPLSPREVCQGPCDGCIGLACFAPSF